MTKMRILKCQKIVHFIISIRILFPPYQMAAEGYIMMQIISRRRLIVTMQRYTYFELAKMHWGHPWFDPGCR